MIHIENINHSFIQGGKTIEVLKNCFLNIKSGEIIALVGSSGAGKTTLLQLIGLLDKPKSGKIIVNGISTHNLNDAKRTMLRRHCFGFVYQFHYLLPEFSALENVILPQLITHINYNKAKKVAEELLDSLKLSHRMHHQPKQLSGGEQQRVAIARALANQPKILLADEPTGNLDPTTAAEVLELLLQLARNHGVTAFIATHNYDLAKKMNRIVALQQGSISNSY